MLLRISCFLRETIVILLDPVSDQASRVETGESSVSEGWSCVSGEVMFQQVAGST